MFVVVPFRSGGKSRLPADVRVEFALAMLGDVVEVAIEVGDVRVVTDDAAGREVAIELGADVIDDPGGGQGEAVTAALTGVDGACLVVNADLPCATPHALRRLATAGLALVAARDGTTNALSLRDPTGFTPLYGPGSAARFAATGLVPLSIPELACDVDILADLERLTLVRGRRTALVTDRHKPAVSR